MPREITIAEFTAEALEAEADKMPPSLKALADILREAAQSQRKYGSARKVRIFEEHEFDSSGFTKPDPASR